MILTAEYFTISVPSDSSSLKEYLGKHHIAFDRLPAGEVGIDVDPATYEQIKRDLRQLGLQIQPSVFAK